MTDRELLELAAKAAGIEPDWYERGIAINHGQGEDDYHNEQWVDIWNPLTDDGDALRLAVKIRLSLSIDSITVCCGQTDSFDDGVAEECRGDPYAATRRAIVRAAAEIGREK